MLISTKTGTDRQKFTIQTHEIFKACCQRGTHPRYVPLKRSISAPWHIGEVSTLACDKCFVLDARQERAVIPFCCSDGPGFITEAVIIESGTRIEEFGKRQQMQGPPPTASLLEIKMNHFPNFLLLLKNKPVTSLGIKRPKKD